MSGGRKESSMRSVWKPASVRRIGLAAAIALVGIFALLGTASAKWSVVQSGNQERVKAVFYAKSQERRSDRPKVSGPFPCP